MNITQTFGMRMPDDWHLHLRDGDAMEAVLPYTMRQMGNGLIMPNLDPPNTNWRTAESYLGRIKAAMERIGGSQTFSPRMTIYLWDKTTPEDIEEAKRSGIVIAVKLYPANATTNSAYGVTDIKKLAPVFQIMAEVGLVLCIHGETLVSKIFGDKTRNGRVGQLRREAVFLDETLSWIVENFPGLKIVLEHISTREAVAFVCRAPKNVVATITPHHLLETLDAVFESHHNKCMPVLKEECHRQALLDAATSGNPKFFGGTDSAPHAKSRKETACGCSGCFIPYPVELYATAFEERCAVGQLEGFLSEFGADFYGVERNPGVIVLRRETWTVPDEVPFGKGEMIVPFWAGRPLYWKVE